MRNFLRLWIILALAATPLAARAQDIRINPVPPGVKPQWTQVPGAPQVSWAPNLPTDVFRYRGKYYFFWDHYFYQGPAPQGPWKGVVKVPQVFYNIKQAYFKTAKKTPEAPGAPEETITEPKARIIEIPPAEPRAPEETKPAPSLPAPPAAEPKSEPAPPATPTAPGAPEPRPKAM